MKDAQFQQILDEVIDRLANGESVEQCLQDYPEQAAELEPLLHVASAAYDTAAVEPRPEFKAHVLQQAYSLPQTVKPKAEHRRLPYFGWQLRWATAVLAIVVFLMAATGGTVAASSDSMPDDTLYPVKMTVERTRLALTFSDTGKAKLHAEFAQRRADELAHMAEKDKAKKVEETSSRLVGHLSSVEQWAERTRQESADDPDLIRVRETLEENNSLAQEAFQEAEIMVGPEAGEAFNRAVAQYNETYQMTMRAFGEGQGAGQGSPANRVGKWLGMRQSISWQS
jgi:hypothetical protein